MRTFALALAISSALSCGSAPPPAPPSTTELDGWAEGPVRWLLTAAERRELRRVETGPEAAAFIEEFWARRAPDPSAEENAFRAAFYRRVEAADLLYEEEGVRGSLTDRGRALILLGPPGRLQIASRPALEWSPQARTRHRVEVREQPLEIWGYSAKDLTPVLAEALADLGGMEQIELTFVVGPRRTHLFDGQEFLDLAARVLVARPH